MNKAAVLIIFLLCLLPLVYGQQETLGAFKTNSCITLKQTCANCTFVNFSLSAPPDLATIISDTAMSKSSYDLWTYSFCNSTVNGQYIYDTYGDIDGEINSAPVDFFVNPIGKILTSGQATLYFLVFIISVIFFILALAFGLTADGNDQRDTMTGYVIAVSNMKYVKMFMVAISYLLLMLILWLGYTISYAYLDLDFLGQLLRAGFIGMVVLIIPLFVIGTFVTIANLVRDKKIGQMLARGLRVR